MSRGDHPEPDLLTLQVRRFNTAIRSGDFGPMRDGFAADAEMVFQERAGRQVVNRRG